MLWPRGPPPINRCLARARALAPTCSPNSWPTRLAHGTAVAHGYATFERSIACSTALITCGRAVTRVVPHRTEPHHTETVTEISLRFCSFHLQFSS
jgi:hypothetical protein